jgi:hypothetical protein
MSRELQVSIGQHSDKGRKPANQDFHGALIPLEPLLSLKTSFRAAIIPTERELIFAGCQYLQRPGNVWRKTWGRQVQAVMTNWEKASCEKGRIRWSIDLCRALPGSSWGYPS